MEADGEADADPAAAAGKASSAPSAEQLTAIKAAIANAQTLEEVRAARCQPAGGEAVRAHTLPCGALQACLACEQRTLRWWGGGGGQRLAPRCGGGRAAGTQLACPAWQHQPPAR